MINPPKTHEVAKRCTYGHKPFAARFVPERCAYEVHDCKSFYSYQCCRKPGHGPDGLYCKQHAKIVERNDDA